MENGKSAGGQWIPVKSNRRVHSAKPYGPTKKYLKTRNACKVTFRLPVIAAPPAERVYLVGDFNNWNPAAGLMNRLKNGEYKLIVEMTPGRKYRYRYVVDGCLYMTDPFAEEYAESLYGIRKNAVVRV